MFYLDVTTIKGVQKEIVYNVDDFPYDECKGKIVRKKDVQYYNISASFDIETTTIEPKNEEKPYGFMYQWQVCIQDKVVFGRYWDDFILFLDKLRDSMGLSNKKRLVMYVHNLAYEFQFIKDFIQIDNVFFKDKRKPMKLISDGIEFRCSYFLSNMSLAKFCENSEGVIHYKITDTYDYRKIRTPETPLTIEEMGYCYNDVRGLCECIDDSLKHDTIVSIPLTSTGYVRREYREAMKKNKNNRHNFTDSALTPELYKMMVRAFRGGNTHANRFMSNMIIDNVWSFDISSSYPSAIAMDYFPMGKFSPVTMDNQEKLDWYCENYCCVFDIEIFNPQLKPTEVIPYIDIAHCYEKRNVLNDNGRVLKADYIKMTITNIDIDIIRKTYNYDYIYIDNAYVSKKAKLPYELREKMMEFYHAKTQLKGVEGKEYEYMKSKNKLNGTFGMMVTAIDHTEIYYDNNNFEWQEVQPNLDDALSDFYRNRNNFLAYQWGVFVTANSRARLQRMLDVVKEDVVYIDTDSIKFVNEKHVKEFEKLNKELEEQAELNDIEAYSFNKDGVKYPLGVWDNDGVYTRFKTLGAKKYAYEQIGKDGKKHFHITVSGMAKKKGAERVGCLENFLIGKTYTDIGRTVSTYNDCKPHNITINGCTFKTASNIGITDTTYTLGVTNEYWELIKDNICYLNE